MSYENEILCLCSHGILSENYFEEGASPVCGNTVEHQAHDWNIMGSNIAREYPSELNWIKKLEAIWYMGLCMVMAPEGHLGMNLKEWRPTSAKI